MNDDESPSHKDLTVWLAQAGFSNERATSHLFTSMYKELRCLARNRLRHESCEHTLSATALTHEAYFRLAAQENSLWKNRGHFMAMAATMMRRILIDYALAKKTDKRYVELVTLSAAEFLANEDNDAINVLDIHQALLEFEQQDERAARIVELRYFGGLSLDEIAEIMNISLATIKRDWVIARAWLSARLS